MRRIAVALATLCLLAGQLIFAGVATGADPTQFTASPLTPDTTFVGAKSTSGAIAENDPALLGRTDSTPVNVMIKYDYDVAASYTGGVDGLAATSPRKTGKTLKANAAAVKAYTDYTTKLSDKITTRAQKAVPGLKVRFAYAGAYGGVEASIPANQIGALLKTDGVVAVQQDTLQQPLDDNTAFIGATKVWPSLGGSANAGSERHRRRHRHRRLARASDGRPGQPRHRPRWRARLPVRRWVGRGPPRPGLHLQQQAHRRLRVQDGHLHGHDRRRRDTSSATTRRHQCSARDSEGHGTHTADHRRRRLRHVRRAVRRRARAGLRYRSRRARDRCTASAWPAGCSSSDSVVGRPAGDHRRRRRHQLLDLGRRPAVHRRRSSSRSSTPSTPGSP